jgi:hypothetical protein
VCKLQPIECVRACVRIGQAAGPAFADAGAVAACMKSSCRVAFGWQVWRSACASCGLVLCGDCASEKATVGGKARESVCKLCKELLDEAAAK